MQHCDFTPKFFLVAATSVFSSMLCTTAVADPARISVAQFSQNQQKVAALKKGIEVMREYSKADPMSEQFRTSLAYWANTHGYVGTGTHATSMQDYIIDYRMPQCLQAYSKTTCDTYYKHIVNINVPSDGFTDSIWGTCQHGNLFFLPWHRFYLHYFERTLRKQSNDPQFTLPYWNYYDNYVPAQKGLSLPPLVLSATNTLFDQWRTPGLNQNSSLMDPSSADATQAFGFADFTNFSNTLQGQPHGAMHCAVGSQCTMPDIGFVPIAGADPVFYMHHANIDRLWQCWMNRQAKGKTIDLAWAKANLGMPDSWYEQAFSFIDENGKPVSLKVADVFTPAYSPQYDNLTNCDAKPTALKRIPVTSTAAMAASPLKAHRPLAAGKKITLGNSTVNVTLQPAVTATNEAASPPKVEQNAAGHTYLVLEDVKLQGSPALTYKVFLISKANPKKSSYIATFSYFGAGPAHAGHGESGSLGTLVYKVSANLAELGITSASDVNVRFEPTNLMVGQKLKSQKAGNGVTVSNIRLETAAVAPTK